jgi:hypothetical protein
MENLAKKNCNFNNKLGLEKKLKNELYIIKQDIAKLTKKSDKNKNDRILNKELKNRKKNIEKKIRKNKTELCESKRVIRNENRKICKTNNPPII